MIESTFARAETPSSEMSIFIKKLFLFFVCSAHRVLFQAECYHYLFEAAIKLHQLGLDCSTPSHGPIQSFKGLSNVNHSVNMSVKAGSAISNNGIEPSHVSF